MPATHEPPDAATAAALLAGARTDRRLIVPRGAGTKIDRGEHDEAVSYLSTRRLATPIQHYPGDLVATLPAGATLAEANAVLGRARQWLPLDPPHGDRATIGGIVATNDSGPRRHAFGAPRDLIIGIEVALADGRVAKAGGRVVKNVAGYDLARLFCGSCGSLGLITRATFRLAPLALTSRTVVVRMPTSERAAALALALAAAPLSPSALEIEGPDTRLLVRFEATEQTADRMAASARAMVEEAGGDGDLLTGKPERDAWDRHEALVWGHTGVVVRVSVLPTDVPPVLHAARDMDAPVVGRAALGVLFVRLEGDSERQAAGVDRLRTLASSRGGHAVLVSAPADLRDRLAGSNGPASAAADVRRAIKARFDPHGVLPPLP